MLVTCPVPSVSIKTSRGVFFLQETLSSLQTIETFAEKRLLVRTISHVSLRLRDSQQGRQIGGRTGPGGPSRLARIHAGAAGRRICRGVSWLQLAATRKQQTLRIAWPLQRAGGKLARTSQDPAATASFPQTFVAAAVRLPEACLSSASVRVFATLTISTTIPYH